jgi:toxin-antitoxin system PIN domain toxin
VIALDTNILVYAHRPEAPLHRDAARTVRALAESGRSWGIPFHVLVEFAAVVSSPKIWKVPSSCEQIAAQMKAWRSSPDLHVLGDDETVWERTVALARAGAIQGGQWYDARIAAVCLAHGVTELWTADRDYSRFASLRTRNPFPQR